MTARLVVVAFVEIKFVVVAFVAVRPTMFAMEALNVFAIAVVKLPSVANRVVDVALVATRLEVDATARLRLPPLNEPVTLRSPLTVPPESGRYVPERSGISVAVRFAFVIVTPERLLMLLTAAYGTSGLPSAATF